TDAVPIIATAGYRLALVKRASFRQPVGIFPQPGLDRSNRYRRNRGEPRTRIEARPSAAVAGVDALALALAPGRGLDCGAGGERGGVRAAVPDVHVRNRLCEPAPDRFAGRLPAQDSVADLELGRRAVG